MTDSRTAILNNIKKSLTDKSPQFPPSEKFSLPAMDFSKDECLKQFVDKAAKAHAEVLQLSSKQSIPDKISNYLADKSQLVVAETPLLNALDWTNITAKISHNPKDCNEQVAISEARCGIAETGSVVMCSSKETPTSLNFLPLTEIVCLSTQQIYGSYEQAWPHIHTNENLPRCINFITGPSCTGDIEQEILWGAHGPKQLIIILYSD
jgi:L-lactate dehydrogenase complex protein LldG